jgi:hypothetical protein
MKKQNFIFFVASMAYRQNVPGSGGSGALSMPSRQVTMACTTVFQGSFRLIVSFVLTKHMGLKCATAAYK